MKFSFLSCLILAIFLNACSNSNSNQSATSESASIAASEPPVPVPHTAASFYKRYEGTIAGQPVIMYLEKDDTNYSGYYYYTKVGKPINLMGMSAGHEDSLTLQEYIPGSTTEDIQAAELRCYFSGNDILGTWKSKQKQFPIALKENYAKGSLTFEMKKYRDTAMLLNDPKSPFATSSYKVPIAYGNSNEAVWLNGQIKKIIGAKNETESIETIISRMDDSFFTNYRSDNLEEIQEYAGKEEEFPYRMNYDETSNCTVRYNENGLVTIEHAVYSYSGGAHGNYASLYHNYDVSAQKELRLQDIITADSISMQKILEQQFRKDYKIPASQSLTEMLFESYLAPTDNFYLSEKGLGFVYNPYEVAAYAVGQIEVFVPYSLLTNYLTPTFKKRINL